MKFFERKSMPLLIAIIFLFMILSRLTWLQVRHYSIEPFGLVGPRVWGLWQVNSSEVRTWNINAIIVLFFLAALLIRLLSHYWTIALFAVTVLMSRGVLLARVGWMSLDLSLSMLVVGWFACLAHYIRSASNLSRIGMWVFLFFASSMEASFCGVGLLLPLYRYSIKASEPVFIPRASLLRPLPIPFQEWLSKRKNRHHTSISDLIAFLCVLVFGIVFKNVLPNFKDESLLKPELFSFLDLHYAGSFFFIVLCAFYGRKKNENFLNFQKLFLASLFLWVLSSLTWNLLGLRPFYTKAILLWVEPVVLCLACACLIYVVQDVKRRVDERRWTHRVSRL